MKNKLIILFSVFALIMHGQDDTVVINAHPFIFHSVFVKNENGDSVKRLEMFRGETKLMTHTVREISGDCNSESIELGDYEITDSTITFYTYWNRAGDAPVSPYGARKQVNAVDQGGRLIPKQSEIYIETSKQGWKENKGIEFLFSTPKNDTEKKELTTYINKVEKDFTSSFVLGTKKELLLKEVKTKLDNQIRSATKDWKKLFGNKFGGYKL